MPKSERFILFATQGFSFYERVKITISLVLLPITFPFTGRTLSIRRTSGRKVNA